MCESCVASGRGEFHGAEGVYLLGIENVTKFSVGGGGNWSRGILMSRLVIAWEGNKHKVKYDTETTHVSYPDGLVRFLSVIITGE